MIYLEKLTLTLWHLDCQISFITVLSAGAVGALFSHTS